MFIGGDFNCTANYTMDRNHKEPHLASQHAIRKLITEHDLCDIWRTLYMEQRQYTWAQTRDNCISMARLDRFYCFKYHSSVIKTCAILPSGFSDHSLIICSVFISNIKSESAYWHFNTSLVQDNFFKDVFIFFGSSLVLGKKILVPYSNGGIMGKKRDTATVPPVHS